MSGIEPMKHISSVNWMVNLFHFTLLFISVSSYSIFNLFPAPVFEMGKVNNFTGAKKIHLVYLFGYSSLFYDYGLESINERNYIAYGPAKAGITLGELCSEKEFGDIFNTTLNLTDKEMCENIYCQSTYKIENFTSSNQRRVFMHCHVCLTRFRQSFVEKVKNGSCHWSNEFYKPWEKCGKIMEYEGDLLPYAQFFYPCYSKKQNRIFFSNTIINRYIYPYSTSVEQLFLTVLYFVLFGISIIFTLVSNISNIKEKKKKQNFISKLKVLFSMKNQIIFLSLVSTLIASILALLSNFIELFLHIYGSILSQVVVLIQFFQIITLWSFVLTKSKSFKMKTFTLRQRLFLIIATFLLLTFALLGLTIFLVRDVITLSNFDPGITFQILIFFWVTISEFLCLVVSVLLWVYTVRMFSILSVQHDNFRDKLKYFFQLKFSQLTILLNISNFITMIFVAVFCAGFFFPGTFSWELTLFSPYLLYCCILINVLIILFGMTNWRNCRQIYCCACSKCFKNESDDEKSDDDNEKSDNQKE